MNETKRSLTAREKERLTRLRQEAPKPATPPALAPNRARGSWTKNPPESARKAIGVWRRQTPEDKRRIGEARDRLHAALDTLGDRVPEVAEVGNLVTLAGNAFQPGSVAARMIAVLWRRIGGAA